MENLAFGVGAVRTVEEVRDGQGNNLLDLGGDEETGDADELELDERYDARGKEAIDDTDGKE